jgi:hypothetical protein
MNDVMNNWTVQLIGMFMIAAAAVAAFWVAEGVGQAAVTALIMACFIAVVHFGRKRFDTIEVMGGVGDERIRTLYTRAIALTGTVMSLVLPGWWLVTVAQGEPNATLNILCAIFGTAFVLSVVLVARRG